MKTEKDNKGIVHFEAPELGVEHGEYGSNSVFYPPHAWLRVLAWGREATQVGHWVAPTVKSTDSEYVVFDGENHVTGVDSSKVEKL